MLLSVLVVAVASKSIQCIKVSNVEFSVLFLYSAACVECSCVNKQIVFLFTSATCAVWVCFGYSCAKKHRVSLQVHPVLNLGSCVTKHFVVSSVHPVSKCCSLMFSLA